MKTYQELSRREKIALHRWRIEQRAKGSFGRQNPSHRVGTGQKPDRIVAQAAAFFKALLSPKPKVIRVVA